MEAVTLETAQRWCSQYESTLRGSFGPERRLPEEWEKELERVPADTVVHAIGRFALLKHFYRLRHTERAAETEGPDPEAANVAARQLLRREPVRVQLAGRTVEVTGRSYSAMYHIAAHDLRIREIRVDLEETARLHAKTVAALEGRRRGRGPLRRRLRRLGEIHRRLFREQQLHRRALLAHALTPSGAPAASDDEAPSWWPELTAEDDAALLAALLAVGPGRYAQLGPPPPARGRGDERAEDFGHASLFATVDRQMRVEPAATYDLDYFQMLTWVRAGAPPVPPELGG